MLSLYVDSVGLLSIDVLHLLSKINVFSAVIMRLLYLYLDCSSFFLHHFAEHFDLTVYY